MEISSESQNDLIEKYVSGAMSSDEALEFETFILTKPDWLQKVDRARVLFEQVYEQEWQSELENTLAERKANKGSFNDKLSNLLGAWFTSIFKPAIAMAMGALIMFTLVPEQAIDNQPIGKIYSGSFGVDRGIGSSNKPIELPIDSDVDHLALKLSSGNELNRVFKIRPT